MRLSPNGEENVRYGVEERRYEARERERERRGRPRASEEKSQVDSKLKERDGSIGIIIADTTEDQH